MGTPIGRTKPETVEDRLERYRRERREEERRQTARAEALEEKHRKAVEWDRKLGEEAEKADYLNQRLDYYLSKGFEKELAISLSRQDWDTYISIKKYTEEEGIRLDDENNNERHR